MPPFAELCERAKLAASAAGAAVLDEFARERSYTHDRGNPKEIKALSDVILERRILETLLPLGLPVLSEEAGALAGDSSDGLRFIVDPLDGTFNFVRRLGPSAISIALWRRHAPLFGAIYHLDEGRLYWGGPGLGAHVGGDTLAVSPISEPGRGAVCTGLPARLDVNDDVRQRQWWSFVKEFGKVRMLGSAAVSLLQVARGSADAYFEQNIMIWDVAAGLALVEGAGGQTWRRPGSVPNAFDVYASNGRLAAPSFAG